MNGLIALDAELKNSLNLNAHNVIIRTVERMFYVDVLKILIFLILLVFSLEHIVCSISYPRYFWGKIPKTTRKYLQTRARDLRRESLVFAGFSLTVLAITLRYPEYIRGIYLILLAFAFSCVSYVAGSFSQIKRLYWHTQESALMYSLICMVYALAIIFHNFTEIGSIILGVFATILILIHLLEVKWIIRNAKRESKQKIARISRRKG